MSAATCQTTGRRTSDHGEDRHPGKTPGLYQLDVREVSRQGQVGDLAGGETPSGAGALRRALAYLRSYKRESGGALVSLLLVSGANLLTPLLIGRAIDDGVGPRRLDIIFIVVGGLVGLALVRGLFTFLQGYLAERASQGVAYDLRDALFERIERLSFSYYDRV